MTTKKNNNNSNCIHILDFKKKRKKMTECFYCGGDCPNDHAHACDGYLGDIDDLYNQEEKKQPTKEKMKRRTIKVTQKEYNLYGHVCSDGIKRVLKYYPNEGTCLVPCEIIKK
tara:strand:- start:10 stop:348 length:339 start_codon:yes stop_codon:yes gene_type:complete